MKRTNSGTSAFQRKRLRAQAVKARVAALKDKEDTTALAAEAAKVTYGVVAPFTPTDVASIKTGRHPLAPAFKDEHRRRNAFAATLGKHLLHIIVNTDALATCGSDADRQTAVVKLATAVNRVVLMWKKECQYRTELPHPLRRTKATHHKPEDVAARLVDAWKAVRHKLAKHWRLLVRKHSQRTAAALYQTMCLRQVRKQNNPEVDELPLALLEPHQALVDARLAGKDVDVADVFAAADAEHKRWMAAGVLHMIPSQAWDGHMWLVRCMPTTEQPWEAWADGLLAPTMFVDRPLATPTKSWMELEVICRVSEARDGAVGDYARTIHTRGGGGMHVDAVFPPCPRMDGDDARELALEVDGVAFHCTFHALRRSNTFTPHMLRPKDAARMQALLEAGMRPCVVFGWDLRHVRATPRGELCVWELRPNGDWVVAMKA